MQMSSPFSIFLEINNVGSVYGRSVVLEFALEIIFGSNLKFADTSEFPKCFQTHCSVRVLSQRKADKCYNPQFTDGNSEVT